MLRVKSDEAESEYEKYTMVHQTSQPKLGTDIMGR